MSATMRIALLSAATSLSLLAFSPPPAQAASPSEQQCTDAGGTFTSDNGTKVCTLPPAPVGNCDNSSCQTTTTTSTGQGNSGNKPTSTCTGPAGQCK